MIRLEAVSDERAESSREPRRRRERGQIYFLRRDAKNRFVTHSKKRVPAKGGRERPRPFKKRLVY
jgi:hypothetical protein